MDLIQGIPSRFAQRIVEKNSLLVPIDVRVILKQYADVIDAPIPIDGIDGVCLNLKVPGKKPRVVINSNNPPLRIRFTEAHELGHILIPWHKGNIVDHLDPEQVEANNDYWHFENEANEFAAELLMPSSWVTNLLGSILDISKVHEQICRSCKVSPIAAARRLSALLPANIAFVCENNSKVEFSGRTHGTLANVPTWRIPFDTECFPYATNHYVSSYGLRSLHWWTLPNEIDGISTDPRPWREVLNGIVEDIGIQADDRKRFKMSVNGVLSAANSAVKHHSPHTTSAVIVASLQRFHDRKDLSNFAKHPKFLDFLKKRASELTE